MARAPKTLRITQGTDEANDGTSRYRVAPDGTVTVPGEVADRLMQGGGFIEVVGDTPVVPVGLVRLRHPDGSGCSWGGTSYAPGKGGVVTVPVTAEADLASHGFVRVEGEPQPAAEEPEAETETPAEEAAEEPAAETEE